MVCRLGVLAYLDVPLGSVGSFLSKATLLRTASGVREQTNKQTNKLGVVVVGTTERRYLAL